MELTNAQARRVVDKGGELEREAAWYSQVAPHCRHLPNVAYFEAKARCCVLAAMWGRLAVL